MAEGSVGADQKKSRQAVQQIKELKRWVDPYHAVRKRMEDARALLELSEGESDQEHARLVAEMLKGRSLEQEADAIAAQLEALELQNMLRGSDDNRDALLTIHSGAGSTRTGCSRPKRACTAWCAFPRSTRSRGATRLLRRCSCTRWWMRTSKSRSTTTICGSMCTGLRGRAGSTSTRRPPRSESRTSRPISWCSARTSAVNSRTRRRRSRC